MKAERIKASRAGMERPMRELARLYWYAIMVRAGCEGSVEALLERRGFLAVVPVRTVWRRVNRYVQRKTKVSFAIAPRYVFIGFDARQFERGMPPWGKVFSISMVQSVVGVGETPWRMDGRKVARFLRQYMETEAPDAEQHMRTHREFGEGDMVQVVQGSLTGFTVRVHRIEGAVAKVLVPLFGKAEQELALPLANLEPSD